jgi:hypothetical protein
MTDQTSTIIDATRKETLDAIAHGLAHSSRSPLLRTPADAGLAFQRSATRRPTASRWRRGTSRAPDRTGSSSRRTRSASTARGSPAHLEPWRSAFGAGNDTEIDFIADYEILHDNGYNVLAFDFRNFGLSGDANGGLQSDNRFEARDVIGTLDYIRSRPERGALAARTDSISNIAAAVGYVSPSQFSRDYKRAFGSPPPQDTTEFRIAATHVG